MSWLVYWHPCHYFIKHRKVACNFGLEGKGCSWRIQYGGYKGIILSIINWGLRQESQSCLQWPESTISLLRTPFFLFSAPCFSLLSTPFFLFSSPLLLFSAPLFLFPAAFFSSPHSRSIYALSLSLRECPE